MSIKLLFADDSVTMQKVIQLTLEDENVDLLFASDGDRAFALAREERPDVVIADVYMPGMDGFQLCEMLKNNPDTAAIPVILISGELENYDPAEGAAAGAVGHITKPFKSGEFIGLIKKYSASAGESPKKAGKAAQSAIAAVEAEDEEGAFVPAVMKLTARAPAMPEGAEDSDEELEVVDEDIDDLAEDLDDLDDEIEGEVLEEEEDEAEAGEEYPAASSARAGAMDMDDALPTTEEIDAAIAGDAEETTVPAALEERGIYGDDGGDVAAVSSGEELPPAREMAADDAAQNLADVLNVVEARGAEPKEETQRGDEALEETIASLNRAPAPVPPKSRPAAAPAIEHVSEGDLWGQTPENPDAGPDMADFEDTGEIVWDAPKRELEEAVRREVETSAPRIIAAETSDLPPERLEELFRETVGRAVDEFIAARAEEVFREEMRRAIDARFKESLDTQMEKAFREEIGRVMAAGFQKAMPRMLAIIDKITVQITPRIAQHMIKIAIERIKKGDIN